MSETRPPRLLRTGDAARTVGRSVQWIRWLVERGDLPVAAMTPARQLLFEPEDVEALAARLDQKRAKAARKAPR